MQRPAGDRAAGHRRRPRGFPGASSPVRKRALRGHAVVQRLRAAAGAITRQTRVGTKTLPSVQQAAGLAIWPQRLLTSRLLHMACLAFANVLPCSVYIPPQVPCHTLNAA